jgi:hypothetical protein
MNLLNLHSNKCENPKRLDYSRGIEGPDKLEMERESNDAGGEAKRISGSE